MPVTMEDLNQLVVPAFPRGGREGCQQPVAIPSRPDTARAPLSRQPPVLPPWVSSLPPLTPSHPGRGRPPPEGQCVFPLDLAGCISDQKGAVGCVPEFLIHFLPAGRPRIGAPSGRPCPSGSARHVAPSHGPTWRCHPSTTRHPAGRAGSPHWLGLRGLAWPWGVWAAALGDRERNVH